MPVSLINLKFPYYVFQLGSLVCTLPIEAQEIIYLIIVVL